MGTHVVSPLSCMIRFLLIRVLGPLILILLVRSVIVAIARALSQAWRTPAPQETRQAEAFQSGGELKKDPVCGTYVSPGAAVTRRIKGSLVHFCSPECRDKYMAS